MGRRRSRLGMGALLLVAVVVAALWVESQAWGRSVLLSTAGVVAALGATALGTRSRRRLQRRADRTTMQALLDLTPLEFEHEVADLLRCLGFTAVEVTGMAGDLQADIVATDPDGESTIVQCKRYAPKRTIGSPVIQSFIGMARIHHDCDRALFVTTGSFTAPASRLAEEHDIELIDGGDLLDLMLQCTGVLA